MASEQAPPHRSSAPSICVSCGRVIGVYEPMIVVTPWGHLTETSLAERREIDPDDECHHPACYSW